MESLAPLAFGKMLNAFRKRQRLTQQALTDKLEGSTENATGDHTLSLPLSSLPRLLRKKPTLEKVLLLQTCLAEERD